MVTPGDSSGDDERLLTRRSCFVGPLPRNDWSASVHRSTGFLLPVSSLPGYHFVAFARCIFQILPVHNLHGSTRVSNQISLLKDSSGDSDACPTCTQHVRQKILR